MSANAMLKAEKRDGRGKGAARKLRSDGRVPAVVYGGDQKGLTVSVDAGEAEHLFNAISVENTIVALDIEGEDAPFQTLVREIQVHPYRPQLLHIDFYRVTEGVMVDVEIPILLEGIPEGVKQSGGVLQQVIHELPVTCLPSKIPESFELDVTELELGDSIHVADLSVEEGVEIQLDPERTICTVVLPKQEIVEEEEEVEVEVIGEELELEEGEELPEGEAPEEAAAEAEEPEA